MGQNRRFTALEAHEGTAGQCFEHKIDVSLVAQQEGTKSFAPSQRMIVVAQKQPNMPQNHHFWSVLATHWSYGAIWCHDPAYKVYPTVCYVQL